MLASPGRSSRGLRWWRLRAYLSGNFEYRDVLSSLEGAVICFFIFLSWGRKGGAQSAHVLKSVLFVVVLLLILLPVPPSSPPSSPLTPHTPRRPLKHAGGFTKDRLLRI